MVYNSQKGRGFNDIFGTLTSTFKPIAEGAADVGASLATGLVSDLLSGKTPKASIKERGNQAKGMVAQRALQSLQGGRGDFSPSSMGWSDKTAKRKRSRSKSQPPAKRSKQTGGRIFPPPIHYPAGNYPGYDMIGRGIISKMRNRMEKECKDWYERQQKGGRRPVKKRKPKKQTGAGKKRKPKKQKGAGKQTGAGKKRKPRKQTGAGKKSRKRSGKKSKSRKQTGDGLWSGLKEIFQ